jgi:heat shock protein HslJ
MKTKSLLLCAIACALVLPMSACKAPGAQAVATASTANLINTYWKLMLIGDEIVETPADTSEIQIVLQAENQRVAGFAGCNRMFGSYVLDGNKLKFAEIGGTKMACEGRMELEERFQIALTQVATWKIAGETLTLQGEDGKTLLTFESRYMK